MTKKEKEKPNYVYVYLYVYIDWQTGPEEIIRKNWKSGINWEKNETMFESKIKFPSYQGFKGTKSWEEGKFNKLS